MPGKRIGGLRQGLARVVWPLLLLTLALPLAPATALAQDVGQVGAQDSAQQTAPGQLQTPGQDEGLFIAPKIKRYLHSHTSYQFGDPYDGRINPLSRLEFPLNSWWGGVEASWRKPGYALNLELMTNLSRETDAGKFKDSDWEEPGRLTTYDEGNCRMERSFTLDMNADFSLAEPLALPRGLDLRPVLGARWQRFTLVSHDGYQNSLQDDGGWKNDLVYVGDGLWFRQDYVMGYLGLKLTAELPAIWPQGPAGQRTQAFLQGDWGPVAGKNTDHHLLRAGNRVTQESTKGDAWHLALGLKVPAGGWGAVSLSCDYLRIRTTGDHYLYNDLGGDAPLEFTFSDGVKVWSDQIAFVLAWEIAL
jgi:hypothetical protein